MENLKGGLYEISNICIIYNIYDSISRFEFNNIFNNIN